MNHMILEANNVQKHFGTTHALRGVSMGVEKGEILAIMGPSGSGKSTLLHCLGAISPIDDGALTFNGTRLHTMNDDERTKLRRTNFGFVFQFGQLVPELSALDNIAVPLLLNGVKRREAYDKARVWLERVGLTRRSTNIPGELSGGEVQRVAIARAMVTEPMVLFADEPTGSLDSLNSEKTMELFVAAVKTHGTTVVMVTHEPTIAAYADREIIVRDGHITGGH